MTSGCLASGQAGSLSILCPASEHCDSQAAATLCHLPEYDQERSPHHALPNNGVVTHAVRRAEQLLSHHHSTTAATPEQPFLFYHLSPTESPLLVAAQARTHSTTPSGWDVHGHAWNAGCPTLCNGASRSCTRCCHTLLAPHTHRRPPRSLPISPPHTHRHPLRSLPGPTSLLRKPPRHHSDTPLSAPLPPPPRAQGRGAADA